MTRIRGGGITIGSLVTMTTLVKFQCSVQDHQTQLEAIQGGHYSERDEIESQMKQAVVVLNEIQASISAQPMMETHLQELKAMADRGRELFITSQELTRWVCVCVCV